ncbi:MAG: reverse transcriptase domain-containing protein, partial [Cyanobacteria bacterium J06649_11]
MKTKSGVYPLLESATDETSLKTEDKEKAKILQQQFCRVFTKEPEGELPPFPSRTNKEVKMNLNIEMVRKEILSINTNKAIGPDEIHPRMLKELVDYICIPLFIIMQKSLSSGVLPCDWKLADVSPIFKKGAKNLAENYRPISLTSIACRILEKIIKNNIMDHLTREKLLSPKQHGFVNGRSTVTQLLNYLDRAADAIAEGKVV